MTGSLRLKGGPELQAFLDQLPAKLAKNVLRGALRAGAKVVQQDARARVNRQSGLTARAIKIDTVTDGGLIKARVKLRGKHSYIGTFLEYGVAPHFINAGSSGISTRLLTKKANRGGVEDAGGGALRIDGQWVKGAVWHPGFVAKPFLRPALDMRAADAVNAVGQYMANRLKIGSINAPTLEVEE